MNSNPNFHPSNLRGYNRLMMDAVIGLAGVVEAMHSNIAASPGIFGTLVPTPTRGIPRLVYRSITGVTTLVGGGIDVFLAQLVPLAGEKSPTPGHAAVLSTLNGVMGDYLAATENPLAIPMQFRQAGQALELNQAAMAAAVPQAGSRLLLLAHGLCMNDLQWQRRGHDHGQQLALDLGYTPIYLHYNSGLHISTNGQELAGLLESLVSSWPVPVSELIIVCHSMGGLVARSALNAAQRRGHTWPALLRKLVFLGTPHHGAPLERGGNWLNILMNASPYSAPLARLGKIRSAGITDLRYGNRLDEDWQPHDRFQPLGDQRLPLPLPPGLACYTMAACTAKESQANCNPLIGDGLVPVPSALGQHDNPALHLAFPTAHRWLGYEMNHLDLLNHPAVYAQLHDWLAS